MRAPHSSGGDGHVKVCRKAATRWTTKSHLLGEWGTRGWPGAASLHCLFVGTAS